MTRKEAREQAFILLFEQTIQQKPAEEVFADAQEARDFVTKPFIRQLVLGVDTNSEAINEEVEKNLKGWKLRRLSRVSYTILRLSVYEILYEPTIPVSVSINEAVELAKKYGSQEDASYINGVLSSLEKTAKYTKDLRAAAPKNAQPSKD